MIVPLIARRVSPITKRLRSLRIAVASGMVARAGQAGGKDCTVPEGRFSNRAPASVQSFFPGRTPQA
jgi:hypothetical protein